jgi:hypothetical protein
LVVSRDETLADTKVTSMVVMKVDQKDETLDLLVD